MAIALFGFVQAISGKCIYRDKANMDPKLSIHKMICERKTRDFHFKNLGNKIIFLAFGSEKEGMKFNICSSSKVQLERKINGEQLTTHSYARDRADSTAGGVITTKANQ